MTDRPARRHSPAVYRRRRLAVLLVVLMVVGAVVALAVWRPWEGEATAAPGPAMTDAAPEPTPSTTSPAPSETPSGPATSPAPAPSSPAASPEASPEASPSASSIPLCSSGDVTVTAEMDRDSYAGDQDPRLSISLVNEGESACAMNVGTSAQAFTISSGPDVWWRSTDCQREPSDQIVQLAPGQTVSSVEPIVWDKTRSSVDTCDGDRPAARAGYYNLVVSVGGIESDERQFRLR